MTPETVRRLIDSGIQMASENQGHYLFTRENFLALVERSASGFGSIGSTGVMSERGLAFLVWRDGRALLKAKDGELEASSAQVEAIRQFSEDLKKALADER